MREFLRDTDSHEITEWREYLRQEPLPEDRADLRWAYLMTLLTNINRAKGAAEVKPVAFLEMLPWVVADVEPDAEGLLAKARAIHEAFNEQQGKHGATG